MKKKIEPTKHYTIEPTHILVFKTYIKLPVTTESIDILTLGRSHILNKATSLKHREQLLDSLKESEQALTNFIKSEYDPITAQNLIRHYNNIIEMEEYDGGSLLTGNNLPLFQYFNTVVTTPLTNETTHFLGQRAFITMHNTLSTYSELSMEEGCDTATLEGMIKADSDAAAMENEHFFNTIHITTPLDSDKHRKDLKQSHLNAIDELAQIFPPINQTPLFFRAISEQKLFFKMHLSVAAFHTLICISAPIMAKYSLIALL